MNIEQKRQEILSSLDGLTFTEIYEVINDVNKILGYRFIDMIKWNNTLTKENILTDNIKIKEPVIKGNITDSLPSNHVMSTKKEDNFDKMESLVKSKRVYKRKDIEEPKIPKKLPTRKRKDFVNYPEDGNWADKVFYAASCFRRAFKAREAADILLKKEDDTPPEIVIQRTGAYLSQMATGINPVFGKIEGEDRSVQYYILEDGNSTNSEYTTAIKEW